MPRSYPSKIVIFGMPGSGKSTFALRLRDSLNIPLYHLDKFFFESHWIERDTGEFLKIKQSIIEGDRWILDGNATSFLEPRWSKADIVLYFNYPRWRCYFRVFKRIFDKNPHIDDRAPNCPEVIHLKLLTYMWGFEKRMKTTIAFLQQKYPKTHFMEIKNDRDVKKAKEFFDLGF